jgi:hypothetical protein
MRHLRRAWAKLVTADDTTSGSKRCEVCDQIKRGVAYDRGTGQMMCDDCYKASGQKAW